MRESREFMDIRHICMLGILYSRIIYIFFWGYVYEQAYTSMSCSDGVQCLQPETKN